MLPKHDDRTTFRISLDMLSGCPGGCQGCTLLDKDAAGHGLWDDDTRQNMLEFVNRSLTEHVEANETRAFKLYLGKGDYLALNEAELDKVANWLSNLRFDLLPGANYVVVSTSCLVKPERLQKAAEKLQAVADYVGFELVYEKVIDLAKLDNPLAFDLYRNNIGYLKDQMGWADVAIQLGPDAVSHNLSGHEIYAKAVELGADLLEIGLIPTVKTAWAMQPVWTDIVGLVTDIYSAWENERRIELAFAGDLLGMTREHSQSQGMRDWMLRESATVRTGLHIDHEGYGSRYRTGIGKIIAAGPVAGFDGFKVDVSTDLVDLDRLTNRQMQQMWRNSTKSKACQSCDKLYACLSVGGGVLMNTMTIDAESESCPLAWKHLFDQMIEDDDKAEFGDLLEQTDI